MRRLIFALAILFLSSVLVFSTAQAGTIRVPDDQPTIQAGINAAVDGDTVLVAPGTYYENIDFIGKAITVRSEAGPSLTTIDGSQSGSVVSFTHGEGPNSIIDSFTITNGSGTYAAPDGYAGGGIYCRHSNPSVDSSPTIINNIITGNSVTGCGAGIYGNEFNGVIRNNIVSNNSANGEGAGIFLRDVRITTTLEGNTITQNTAGGHGGGIWILTYGTPNIRNNTITLNTAGGNGGGVNVNEWFNGTGAYATIENNTIHQNSALSGGGIYYDVNATISNNAVTENTATSLGGGIYARTAGGIISNNTISKNTVSNPGYSLGSGGGIACYDNSNPTIIHNTITENFAFQQGGGIFCWHYSNATIDGNLISKNSTDLNYYWTEGGGVVCYEGSNVTIKNNTIAENSSVYGGGIESEASSIQILKNLIYKNSAVKRGGGILFNGTAPNHTFTLTNNTLTNNTADIMGGGIYCMWYCDVTQNNDILWNNNSPLGTEIALGWGSGDEITFTTSYSDVEGGQSQVYINPYSPNVILNWGLGMIDADPLFADPTNDEYHLQRYSPCIDAGDPNSPLDPDGTRADMGAFYYHQGGHNCFLAGTAILMADEKTKPIENIKVGDLVRSVDASGNIVVNKVTKLFVHPDIKGYILLKTKDGKALKVTKEHRVKSGNDYKAIGELTIDSPMAILKEGKLVKATITSMQKADTTQTVYNFEVENAHTYFANGYLVHNRKIIQNAVMQGPEGN